MHIINYLSYSFYFVGRPKRQALKDDPLQVEKVDQVDQVNNVDAEMLNKKQEDKCQGEFLFFSRLMVGPVWTLLIKKGKGSPGTDRREPQHVTRLMEKRGAVQWR